MQRVYAWDHPRRVRLPTYPTSQGPRYWTPLPWPLKHCTKYFEDHLEMVGVLGTSEIRQAGEMIKYARDHTQHRCSLRICLAGPPPINKVRHCVSGAYIGGVRKYALVGTIARERGKNQTYAVR